MFEQKGPNEVTSADGFTVKRLGRSELLYAEEGGKIVVEVEPGDGLAIYRASIKDWHQEDGSKKAVTSDEVAVVLERIEAALRFLGVKFVIC